MTVLEVFLGVGLVISLVWWLASSLLLREKIQKLKWEISVLDNAALVKVINEK